MLLKKIAQLKVILWKWVTVSRSRKETDFGWVRKNFYFNLIDGNGHIVWMARKWIRKKPNAKKSRRKHECYQGSKFFFFMFNSSILDFYRFFPIHYCIEQPRFWVNLYVCMSEIGEVLLPLLCIMNVWVYQANKYRGAQPSTEQRSVRLGWVKTNWTDRTKRKRLKQNKEKLIMRYAWEHWV